MSNACSCSRLKMFFHFVTKQFFDWTILNILGFHNYIDFINKFISVFQQKNLVSERVTETTYTQGPCLKNTAK